MKLCDLLVEDFSAVADADDATERLVDLMSQAYNNGNEPPYDPVRYDRDHVHIRVPYRDRTSNDIKKQLEVITKHIGVDGERLRPDRTNAYVYIFTTTEALAKWKRDQYPSSEAEWQAVANDVPTRLSLSNNDPAHEWTDTMAQAAAEVERHEKAVRDNRNAEARARHAADELQRHNDAVKTGKYGPPDSLFRNIMNARDLAASKIGPQRPPKPPKKRPPGWKSPKQIAAEIRQQKENEARAQANHERRKAEFQAKKDAENEAHRKRRKEWESSFGYR